MIYQHFAFVYDQLMKDAPYEQWLQFIEKSIHKYGNGKKRLLDLGCGTGALSIPLALKNYEVTGVDVSEEMLSVAQEKSVANGAHIAFYQQDMRELSGFSSFDIIGVFCDSLNYLETEEDVQATFTAIYEQLTKGGLLLFDVHSLYKINHLFSGKSYCSNDEEISYIWNCYEGNMENSVEHELTFFIRKNNVYHRFDEIHFQRTFPIATYQHWLETIGFTILEITADFTEKAPTQQSERIFFVAKK